MARRDSPRRSVKRPSRFVAQEIITLEDEDIELDEEPERKPIIRKRSTTKRNAQKPAKPFRKPAERAKQVENPGFLCTDREINSETPYELKYTNYQPTEREFNAEYKRVEEAVKEVLEYKEEVVKKEFIGMIKEVNVFKKPDGPPKPRKYAPFVFTLPIGTTKMIEVPSIPNNPMKTRKFVFYEPLVVNECSADEFQISNIPHLHDAVDDRTVVAHICKSYPNGIHGYHENKYEISDQILFLVMRKLIPDTKNPDLLYYSLHKLFPNVGLQKEIANIFPKLAIKYNMKLKRIETWKTEKEIHEPPLNKIPGNIEKIMAKRRNFLAISIKMPTENSADFCSEECFNTLTDSDLTTLLKKFQLTDGTPEELEVAVMKGAPVKSNSPFFNDLLHKKDRTVITNFCQVAKKFPQFSCAIWFKTLLKIAKPPMEEDVAPMSWQDRNRRFLNVIQIARRIFVKHQKEIGADPGHHQYGSLSRPCDHLGPCGPDVEECSCDGICSVYCGCDVNCNRKLNGCRCTSACGTSSCTCFSIGFECSPLTCGNCFHDDDVEPSRCKNRIITNGVSKIVHVKKSGIAGNGAFIGEDVKKGEYIGEYVGERVTSEEAERRGRFYELNMSYLFDLKDGSAIDATRAGNQLRFVNNSATPNCETYSSVVRGEERIGFHAKKDLKAGEELTFHYNYSSVHAERFFKMKPEDRLPKMKSAEPAAKKVKKEPKDNYKYDRIGTIIKREEPEIVEVKTRSGRIAKGCRLPMSNARKEIKQEPVDESFDSAFYSASPPSHHHIEVKPMHLLPSSSSTSSYSSNDYNEFDYGYDGSQPSTSAAYHYDSQPSTSTAFHRYSSDDFESCTSSSYNTERKVEHLLH